MNEQEVQKDHAVGNYQISMAMPNGGQLSVSGYIMLSDDEAELNKRMDLHVKVLARQQRKAELPLLEAQIEKLEMSVTELQRQHAELVERNKVGKLSSQEQMTYRNIPVSIKHQQDQIEEGRARLDALRAELG